MIKITKAPSIHLIYNGAITDEIYRTWSKDINFALNPFDHFFDTGYELRTTMVSADHNITYSFKCKYFTVVFNEKMEIELVDDIPF